jgi:hypothetical protein
MQPMSSPKPILDIQNYLPTYVYLQNIFNKFPNGQDLFVKFCTYTRRSHAEPIFFPPQADTGDMADCFDACARLGIAICKNDIHLAYFAYYLNTKICIPVEKEDFFFAPLEFIASHGEIEPGLNYFSVPLRKYQEKEPKKTFKMLYITKNALKYINEEEKNNNNFLYSTPLGNIITNISNEIKQKNISTDELKTMSQKTFFKNFEKNNWNIANHTRSTIWKIFTDCRDF